MEIIASVDDPLLNQIFKRDKIIIYAGSGTGKSTTCQLIPILCPKINAIDIDDIIKDHYDPNHAAELSDAERSEYRAQAEELATEQAIKNEADVIFVLGNRDEVRQKASMARYKEYAFYLDPEVQRNRIIQRAREGDRIEGCLEGQSHTQNLGYPLIDANLPPIEVASIVVKLTGRTPELGLGR